MKEKIEQKFKLKKHNTNIKTEIFAGLATFLAMSYILVVNPNNLLVNGTLDIRWPSVFLATALGAFFGTMLMAFVANKPFGAASSMGINATIGAVIGGSLGFSFSYGNGMFIIFASGIIFLLLSIIPVTKTKEGKKVTLREKIFDGTPKAIRQAVPVGIGLFIAFIGLKNSGLIVSNQYTLLQVIEFNNMANWQLGGPACIALVTLFGLIVIAVLSHYKVKGSVVIGILSATLLAIPLKVADLNILLGNDSFITWKFWENFANFFNFNPNQGGVFISLFTEGLNFPEGSLFTVFMIVLTFIILDLFDTIGTVVGCSTNAGLIDSNGKPQDYNKIMYSDSLASCAGAVIGTSTVSIFVESGAGIASGGKTGLTAFTIALLFLLSIFILPLFAFIPISAASAALIYVGVIMIKNINEVDFDNIRNAVPAFLTIIMMPLSHSITDGIGIGIVSYFIINILIYIIDLIKYSKTKVKPKLELSLITTVITILFLIYFLVPTIL